MTTLLEILTILFKMALIFWLTHVSIAFFGRRLAKTEHFKEKMRRKYGP